MKMVLIILYKYPEHSYVIVYLSSAKGHQYFALIDYVMEVNITRRHLHIFCLNILEIMPICRLSVSADTGM